MIPSLCPNNAIELFEHLGHWGEIAVYEVEELGAEAWVSVLEGASTLEVVYGDGGQPVAWHLAPAFVHLLGSDAQQVTRRLCFAVPEYRAYLVGILAEGLVDASRAGMNAYLERWTGTELAPLLPELNTIFDGLERGDRLVDLSKEEFEVRMARLPERALRFEDWDGLALGQSARPKALFEFALRRFAPLSGPLPLVEDPAAVLHTLPLNREDGFAPATAWLPQAWNTQRFRVLSGAAIVDPHGRLLFNEDAPLKEIFVEHLRDAISEHPFYAAVIHLAICAWRSPASTMPAVEIYVPAAGALHDVSVLVGSRGAGRVADLLGDLVRAQGYAPFGLVDGRVPDELMGNLLRNLLELRVLCHQGELLMLHDDYQSSLMAARLRTVFRPGKELQKRIVEELALRPPAEGRP